ncbi:MAG: WhiB family transcriptional regulator [Dermatophilaceae bacterium]
MAQLCRGCPGRQQCLQWALAGQEQGYWAGTTTDDRRWMDTHGQTDVQIADRLQESVHRQVTMGALHREGKGSYYWYRRRGCRCGECQWANSAARAEERAKALGKNTVAA